MVPRQPRNSLLSKGSKMIFFFNALVMRPCASFSSKSGYKIFSRPPYKGVMLPLSNCKRTPSGCQRNPISTRPNMSESDDATNHQKYYKISGTGRKSAVTMKTNTGHELSTDVPKKMGGSDSAPQPVEHLLAALVGCTQATAVYVGRMMQPRLIIDRIDFDLEGFRDERGALELPIETVPKIPAKLHCVSGTVTVFFKKGVAVSEEQLILLGNQTEQRCPVANMMHASGCNMDIRWINGNTL